MCGRLALDTDFSDFPEPFRLVRNVWRDMPPRLNIAPTQPLAMIINNTLGEREGLLVRWGFVPAWVKDPKDFSLIINARCETAFEKPSFKSAMRHRRALVPASGFYEWKRFGKGRKSQAYWVRPRDGGFVTFGALMETWSGANGSEVDTGCIMTTDANSSFSEIHHRLPLVVHPRDIDRWLDCKTQEPRDVLDLMAPVDDDYFEAIPIGDEVNKVANTDASIQQRVEPRVEAAEPDEEEQLSMF